MPDNNNPSQTIQLKIKRQEGPEATPYWEEFEIPYRPHMNVVSCLMEIRKIPSRPRQTYHSCCLGKCLSRGSMRGMLNAYQQHPASGVFCFG